MELRRILNRAAEAWRIVATVISFMIFGAGGLVIACLWIPCICFLLHVRAFFLRSSAGVTRSRRHELTRRSIAASFRLFIRFIRSARVIDYRIENAGRLAADDGCLIVANHPSLLDYVFLASLVPCCDCIVKEALLRNPFTRHIVRAAGYIPNHDPEQLLEACRARLAAGGRIVVFPEGTRSTPGQPLRLRRGAANIAIRSGVPLRVVHITCTPPILTRQQKWWRTAPVRPLFRIVIREKIDIAPFLENNLPPSRAVRLLNDRLQTALAPSGAGY
ncbi:glycerol acyltransferase [Opitutaceae bacterium TAV5]|nr:glycerol acyltransferase [Opitutaceae bacterium TAV5]